MVSGSKKELIFWNISDFKSLQIIKGIKTGDSDSITEIQNKFMLIIGGYNDISFINIKSYNIIKILNLDYQIRFNNAVTFYNNSFIFAYQKGFLQINEYYSFIDKCNLYEYNVSYITRISNELVITCFDNGKLSVWK